MSSIPLLLLLLLLVSPFVLSLRLRVPDLEDSTIEGDWLAFDEPANPIRSASTPVPIPPSTPIPVPIPPSIPGQSVSIADSRSLEHNIPEPGYSPESQSSTPTPIATPVPHTARYTEQAESGSLEAAPIDGSPLPEGGTWYFGSEYQHAFEEDRRGAKSEESKQKLFEFDPTESELESKMNRMLQRAASEESLAIESAASAPTSTQGSVTEERMPHPLTKSRGIFPTIDRRGMPKARFAAQRAPDPEFDDSLFDVSPSKKGPRPPSIKVEASTDMPIAVPLQAYEHFIYADMYVGKPLQKYMASIDLSKTGSWVLSDSADTPGVTDLKKYSASGLYQSAEPASPKAFHISSGGSLKVTGMKERARLGVTDLQTCGNYLEWKRVVKCKAISKDTPYNQKRIKMEVIPCSDLHQCKYRIGQGCTSLNCKMKQKAPCDCVRLDKTECLANPYQCTRTIECEAGECKAPKIEKCPFQDVVSVVDSCTEDWAMYKMAKAVEAPAYLYPYQLQKITAGFGIGIGKREHNSIPELDRTWDFFIQRNLMPRNKKFVQVYMNEKVDHGCLFFVPSATDPSTRAYYDISTLKWIPADSQLASWMFRFKDIKIGDTWLDVCPDAGCKAVFNLASWFTKGPADEIMKIVEQADTLMTCAGVKKQPPITFSIAGREYTFSSAEYVRKATSVQSGDKGCVGAWIPTKMCPSKSDKADITCSIGRLWSLGAVFFSKIFLILDGEKNRIGIADPDHDYFKSQGQKCTFQYQKKQAADYPLDLEWRGITTVKMEGVHYTRKMTQAEMGADAGNYAFVELDNAQKSKETMASSAKAKTLISTRLKGPARRRFKKATPTWQITEMDVTSARMVYTPISDEDIAAGKIPTPKSSQDAAPASKTFQFSSVQQVEDLAQRSRLRAVDNLSDDTKLTVNNSVDSNGSIPDALPLTANDSHESPGRSESSVSSPVSAGRSNENATNVNGSISQASGNNETVAVPYIYHYGDYAFTGVMDDQKTSALPSAEHRFGTEKQINEDPYDVASEDSKRSSSRPNTGSDKRLAGPLRLQDLYNPTHAAEVDISRSAWWSQEDLLEPHEADPVWFKYNFRWMRELDQQKDFDLEAYLMRFKEGADRVTPNLHTLGNWRAIWRRERDFGRKRSRT